MTRWNLAAVVGVPGVGKTSLCRQAAQSLGYSYVNYGELLLEFSKKGKYATTQEEMFKLPLELQYDIWFDAAQYVRDLTVFKKHLNGILVDLHGIDVSKKGYLISLPAEIIMPKIIIVVESTYNQIIQQRINDPERTRPIERLETIKQNMELLRNSMAACSAITGSYLAVLENVEFEKSLKRLKKYL